MTVYRLIGVADIDAGLQLKRYPHVTAVHANQKFERWWQYARNHVYTDADASELYAFDSTGFVNLHATALRLGATVAASLVGRPVIIYIAQVSEWQATHVFTHCLLASDARNKLRHRTRWD